MARLRFTARLQPCTPHLLLKPRFFFSWLTNKPMLRGKKKKEEKKCNLSRPLKWAVHPEVLSTYRFSTQQAFMLIWRTRRWNLPVQQPSRHTLDEAMCTPGMWRGFKNAVKAGSWVSMFTLNKKEGASTYFSFFYCFLSYVRHWQVEEAWCEMLKQ